MKRVFIALPIPVEISASILPLQRGIEGARFSPPENFHITLRFLGDLNEDLIEDLDNELGEIEFPKFDLRLAGFDFFGGEKPHSLHAKLTESDELRALQQKCDDICNRLRLWGETKKFTPHLTIAYFPNHTQISQIMDFCARNALFKSKIWCADRFYLYASTLRNGPSHYEILAEYPLRG